MLYQGSVIFRSAEDVDVYNEGRIIEQIKMEADITGAPTILKYDSLEWFIIQREDKFGIRLRDFTRPEIKDLDSIPCYPVEIKWRLQAELKKFDTPRKISLKNVLGMFSIQEVTGVLVFEVNGRLHELYPIGTDDKLWVIFADMTSGLETYGGGRYLEIDGPDKHGKYIIDFNKAYNPPCAFTEYATCPLPPGENILDIGVRAGEKNIHH